MDETEVKERLSAAFDKFVKLGFLAHLIGVRVRGGNDYSILLESDGHGDISMDNLDDVAAEFRLDRYWDKNRVMLYARADMSDTDPR